MKKLVIVIPTFNRCHLLRKTLTQLVQQASEFNDIDTSIVVVNDGCTDETASMVSKEFAQVVQITTRGNLWYTKSINVGFAEALNLKADLVLTLNDDIELKTDYLRQLTNAAAKYSEPTIIGSTSLTYDKPHRVTFSGVKKIDWWRFKQTNYHGYLEQIREGSISGERESVLLPGRGMLIDARILKKIGFFEPKLVQYASDDEFCYRATSSGYKVYVSWDAIIYSHHELTGAGAVHLKPTFLKFLNGFFNPYTKNYWKKHCFIIWNYGIKPLFPLTITMVLLGEFYSFLKYKFK